MKEYRWAVFYQGEQYNVTAKDEAAAKKTVCDWLETDYSEMVYMIPVKLGIKK